MPAEFIDWSGGPMPIEIGTPVVTRHRHGKGNKHSLAGEGYATRWSHTGEVDDIVAYRLDRDSDAPSPATNMMADVFAVHDGGNSITLQFAEIKSARAFRSTFPDSIITSAPNFPFNTEGQRIADAVLAWLVKHDLADADNEYRAADVIAIMDDLAPAPENDAPCPICDEPFKPDDLCASDITEGTCHAECLEGSPVVDLETGDEVPGGKVDIYQYSEVMDPPREPTSGGPAYLDFITPDEIFDKGPAAVKKWQEAKLAELLPVGRSPQTREAADD